MPIPTLPLAANWEATQENEARYLGANSIADSGFQPRAFDGINTVGSNRSVSVVLAESKLNAVLAVLVERNRIKPMRFYWNANQVEADLWRCSDWSVEELGGDSTQKWYRFSAEFIRAFRFRND